ncbi:MAG: DUF559 domain-containing protein [Candidatus Delongbacteria bacterium]|nr:DUF559 domain-containing protein [Candidatus Delongbacteria bacterium]
MARVPIRLKKVLEVETRNNRDLLNEEFIFSIDVSHTKWKLSYDCDRKELVRFRDEINEILGYASVAKLFKCTLEEAEKIIDYHSTEKICVNCQQKNILCYDCIYTCQSPLEQLLYIALTNSNIKSELQKRINKDGSSYSKELPINWNTILTVPDFYVESPKKMICVYADGHTYHGTTEEQALRDRKIDRELQDLNFVVLRYPGKQIREDIDTVVADIKKRI